MEAAVITPAAIAPGLESTRPDTSAFGATVSHFLTSAGSVSMEAEESPKVCTSIAWSSTALVAASTTLIDVILPSISAAVRARLQIP